MTYSERAGSKRQDCQHSEQYQGLQITRLETGEASQAALGKGVVYSFRYGDLPDNYIIGITVKF